MMRAMCSVAFVVAIAGFPTGIFAAAPSDARSYAIFAADDVTLNSYSSSQGDIYSGYNLTLDNGYGIQRPAQNVGDLYAVHNISTGGQCHLTGNIYANADVSLEYWNDISGNVTYGGSLTYDDRNNIKGSVINTTGTVPAIALPSATKFSAGTNDISTSDSLNLQPGQYGRVTLDGVFKSLTLHSGNYYLKSLTFTSTETIYLDLSSGPINVFSEGDISLESGLQFYVNGTQYGEDSSDAFRDLARNVLFESHGYVTIPGGYLSSFFGSIFAPYGNIDVDLQDMSGQMLAGKTINANVYMDMRPSSYLAVPEQSTFVLLTMASLSAVFWLFRGRWMQRNRGGR